MKQPEICYQRLLFLRRMCPRLSGVPELKSYGVGGVAFVFVHDVGDGDIEDQEFKANTDLIGDRGF